MSRKISVIIPCYNLRNEIGRCIESILGQSYRNIEVLVVDDGSKDDSVEVIQSYCVRDERIKCIQQENQGPSAARNKGIEAATGDYIMFVDGDDYIGQTYIEKMVDAIVDDCDMVIAGLRYVYPDGRMNIVSGISFQGDRTVFLANYYSKCIKNRLIFGPYNKLYRKALMDRYEICFDESIEIREDGLFVLSMIEKAENFCGIENSEYFYIQHGLNDSLVTKFHDDEREINRRFFDEMIRIRGKQELSGEDVADIYPMYLNMDISSIRKYFNSKNPDYPQAMKYIKNVLSDSTFKKARRELLAVNKKTALKYYRPALLFYIINRMAVKK